MKFFLPFRYVFDQPGGFSNLLHITVCELIPVIGPIILYGYRSEVSVTLDYDPEMSWHPRFEFNRFEKYLARGVWPFLIELLLAVLHFPIIFGVFIAGAILLPNMPNPGLTFLVIEGVSLCFIVVLDSLKITMVFHAELTGRFDLPGGLRFSWQFWRLVGLVALGTGFVFWFMSAVVLILGLLCCFVGIYPAIALIQMARQHLMVQLYRLYLDRGGEPLIEEDRNFRDEHEEEFEDEYEEEDRDER
jgi:hypothetical protein